MGHAHDLFFDAADAADAILRDIYKVDVYKALDPLKTGDFEKIVAKLGRSLARHVVPVEDAALKRAIQALDIDWNKMNAEARSRVVQEAQKYLGAPFEQAVLPKIDEELSFFASDFSKRVKRSTVLTHKLAISPNLSATDARIAQFARVSQGHYVRNELGQRVEAFGDDARDIVRSGLERGLGSAAISEELAEKLADAKRGPGYWTMIAMVFANRARTSIQLFSFGEAGIEFYTWESVLDEATSMQCRFMHGRRFEVAGALKSIRSVEEADAPEAVREHQPFMNLSGDALYYKDADGKRVDVARVTENVVGQKDKIGSFSNAMSHDKLVEAGIRMPPAHGHCRSTVVPEIGPATPARPVPAAPAPGAPVPAPARPAGPKPPRLAPAAVTPSVPSGEPLALPPPASPSLSKPVEQVYDLPNGKKRFFFGQILYPGSSDAEGTFALERAAKKDGSVPVTAKTSGLAPAPKSARGSLPYEDAFKSSGKAFDKMLADHGESFLLNGKALKDGKVTATKDVVDQSIVGSFIAKTPKDEDAPVIIVRSGGKYYLHDGHERVIAEHMKGTFGSHVEMKATLVDLDKIAPPSELQKITPKKLAEGLAKHVPTVESSEASQRETRDLVRGYLKSNYNLASRDERRNAPGFSYDRDRTLPSDKWHARDWNKYDVKNGPEMAGLNGYHTWQGEIAVIPKIRDEVVRGAKGVAADGKAYARALLRNGAESASQEVWGFRTLLHEEIHGASKIKSSAYKGVGVGIEEALTETLARRAARDYFGTPYDPAHPDRALFEPPRKAVSGDHYVGGQGSYPDYVRSLFSICAKHTGHDGIAARIEDAIISSRQWSKGEEFSKPEEQIEDFVNRLRSGVPRHGGVMPDAVRKKLVEELSNPRGPMAGT